MDEKREQLMEKAVSMICKISDEQLEEVLRLTFSDENAIVSDHQK